VFQVGGHARVVGAALFHQLPVQIKGYFLAIAEDPHLAGESAVQ
jgi:hypothetical protein